MRPIIESGRFFIARPPLYLIRNTRTKETQYAYSEEERHEIEKAWGLKNTTLQRYKGLGEMNPEQLRETVFVLPESVANKTKKRAKDSATNEKQLTVEDFNQRDLRMVIEDVHRTRTLISQLMGSDVGPRKEWLMSVDWTEEE